MSSERDVKAERNARLRARVLGAAAPTCMVVAAAMATPATAQAAERAPVALRAGEAAVQSAHGIVGDVTTVAAPAIGESNKQWWHNGFVRPWANWNNWHNFAPWANWHNWGRW